MKKLPAIVTEAARPWIRELPGRELLTEEEAEGKDAAVIVARLGERFRFAGRGEPVVCCEAHAFDLAQAAEKAAQAYERSLLPPFTAVLAARAEGRPRYFATPGHHGGAFFRETAGGRLFCSLLGEGVFRMDLSDSDDAIGDTSSHEGPGGEAEAFAAEVWHADRTYFVLNGTSASNRICCAALLAPGDLVLFDRNNHKSVYQGALTQCGAVPVWLDAVRNEKGVIGGIPAKALDEEYLRALVRKAAPGKEKRKRPFRLACLQLCTYDGIFANAEMIVKKIGPLCDYILFDGAWAGYENFIPFMREKSPLLLPLGKKDPGILVTQSVHKQLAGFSQTSQIQRKDGHLAGKKRRVGDDVFQNAFLQHVSTSPCFPLFAGLEMNAAIHKEKGQGLWAEAVRFAAGLRKRILAECHFFRPFQPDTVGGRPWASYAAEEIAGDRRFWEIRPGGAWHGFRDIVEGQYLLDPCKVLLVTEEIPAPAAAAYLMERGIVPEKAGMHTLLLLAEPGDTEEKAAVLTKALKDFERDWEEDLPLIEALPKLAEKYPSRYGGAGLRALCGDMEAFLRENGADVLMKTLFETGGVSAMGSREANEAFVRGEGELLPLRKAAGRIALESAAAYPPGICRPAAGERWTEGAIRFYECLADFGRKFPGFAPELHGVHEGKHGASVWVLRGK